MQENVILCVSGITQKTKQSYFITFLEKILKNKKILGVIIENKVNFKSQLCKKPSQKIAALSRFSSYLHNSEKKLIFNSIIKSKFSYCSLVWMVCSRTSNNMIKKLHERSITLTNLIVGRGGGY